MASGGRSSPGDPVSHHHGDEGAVQVKRSVTGTIKMETGNSKFYSKPGIKTINDGSGDFDDRTAPIATKVHRIFEGNVKFPKLEECAHFHYDFVELDRIEVNLVMEQENVPNTPDSLAACQWPLVVTVGDRSSVVRRSHQDFISFDQQLHRCIYDRRFSQLPELRRDDVRTLGLGRLVKLLSEYMERFSQISGNMINCGPVLSWLELDNRGNRLIVSDDSSAVNIPAMAAAHVVKRYISQAPDELSLEVGDMVSLIMMPSDETSWWRGKKVFEVGFFPSNCVEVIGGLEKLPSAVTSKVPSTPNKPVINKHGKLVAFLRTFFNTRPSRMALKRSGIVRERVFGCDLGEHLLNSDHPDDVPALLRQCAEFIETEAIVDGIYRLSGSASNIQKLRNEFDAGNVPVLTAEEYMQDVHCVSSLIKMYFRELPNPLFTYQLYDRFIEAFRDEENRLMRIFDVIQQLPPPHFRTAKYLLCHLSRVAVHHRATNMHTKNLAIVWAPNLIRPKQLTGTVYSVEALQDVSTQAVVTEYLITYAELIFSDSAPHTSAGQQATRPKSVAVGLTTTSKSNLISLDEAREKFMGPHNTASISGTIDKQLSSSMYHTVLDRPASRKKQTAERRSIFSIFSRNRSLSKDLDDGTYDDGGSSSRTAVELVQARDIDVTGTALPKSTYAEIRRVPTDRLRAAHSVDLLAFGGDQPGASATAPATPVPAGDHGTRPQTIVNPHADEFANIRPRASTLQHPKHAQRSLSADYNTHLYNTVDPRVLSSTQQQQQQETRTSRQNSAVLNNLARHSRIVEELEKRTESRSSLTRHSVHASDDFLESATSGLDQQQPQGRHSIAVSALSRADDSMPTASLYDSPYDRHSIAISHPLSLSPIEGIPSGYGGRRPGVVDRSYSSSYGSSANYENVGPVRQMNEAAVYIPTPFVHSHSVGGDSGQLPNEMYGDVDSWRASSSRRKDAGVVASKLTDSRASRVSQSVPSDVISSFLLAGTAASPSRDNPPAMSTFQSSLSQPMEATTSPVSEQPSHASGGDMPSMTFYGSLDDLGLVDNADDEVNSLDMAVLPSQYDDLSPRNNYSSKRQRGVIHQYDNVVLPTDNTPRRTPSQYVNVSLPLVSQEQRLLRHNYEVLDPEFTAFDIPATIELHSDTSPSPSAIRRSAVEESTRVAEIHSRVDNNGIQVVEQQATTTVRVQELSTDVQPSRATDNKVLSSFGARSAERRSTSAVTSPRSLLLSENSVTGIGHGQLSPVSVSAAVSSPTNAMSPSAKSAVRINDSKSPANSPTVASKSFATSPTSLSASPRHTARHQSSDVAAIASVQPVLPPPVSFAEGARAVNLPAAGIITHPPAPPSSFLETDIDGDLVGHDNTVSMDYSVVDGPGVFSTSAMSRSIDSNIVAGPSLVASSISNSDLGISDDVFVTSMSSAAPLTDMTRSADSESLSMELRSLSPSVMTSSLTSPDTESRSVIVADKASPVTRTRPAIAAKSRSLTSLAVLAGQGDALSVAPLSADNKTNNAAAPRHVTEQRTTSVDRQQSTDAASRPLSLWQDGGAASSSIGSSTGNDQAKLTRSTGDLIKAAATPAADAQSQDRSSVADRRKRFENFGSGTSAISRVDSVKSQSELPAGGRRTSGSGIVSMTAATPTDVAVDSKRVASEPESLPSSSTSNSQGQGQEGGGESSEVSKSVRLLSQRFERAPSEDAKPPPSVHQRTKPGSAAVALPSTAESGTGSGSGSGSGGGGPPPVMKKQQPSPTSKAYYAYV